MEFHEYADLFPLVSDRAINEMAADIAQNGQKVPIIVYEGKILDGRCRFLACKAAFVEPITRKYDGSDPRRDVISWNFYRRDLTPGQRAIIGAEIKPLYAVEAKERQREHGATAPGKKANTSGNVAGSVGGDARDQAAAAAGVSGKSIDAAEKIIREAPDLAAKIKDGKMALNAGLKALNRRKGDKPAKKPASSKVAEPSASAPRAKKSGAGVDAEVEAVWKAILALSSEQRQEIKLRFIALDGNA